MNREPVSFEITDDTGMLYSGTEDEMMQVFTIIISDLKGLQQKYGKQAVQMKTTYNAKPKGTVKLNQVHKLHVI